MTDTPEQGWYDDPADPSQRRWWDGREWTHYTFPKPPGGSDDAGDSPDSPAGPDTPDAPASPDADGKDASERQRLRLIAIVGGVVVLLLALGVAGWWFLLRSVDVPDVTGASFQDARAELRAAGLEVARDTESALGGDGSVLRQDPASGESVDPGAEVTVFVSVAAEMPDLVGEDAGQARERLESQGAQVELTDVRGEEAGTVVAQEPEAGADLTETVRLEVADGRIAALTVAVPTPDPSVEPTNLARSLGEHLSSRLGLDVTVEFVPMAAAADAFATGADVIAPMPAQPFVRALVDHDAVPIVQLGPSDRWREAAEWYTTDPDTFCADEPVAVPFEVDDRTVPMRYCNGLDGDTPAQEGPLAGDTLAAAGTVPIALREGSTSEVLALESLQGAGLDPEQLALFVGPNNPVVLLRDGTATIAAAAIGTREALVTEEDDIGQQTVVFARTDSSPHTAFVVHPDLPEQLRGDLTTALVSLVNSDPGQPLRDFYRIDQARAVEEGQYDTLVERFQASGVLD